MAKDYTGTQLKNVLLRIIIPHIQTDGASEPEYFAGNLKSQAIICDADGKELSTVVDETTLGTAKSVPWTNKEIYDYICTIPGTSIANKLKNLYLDGINEDISV